MIHADTAAGIETKRRAFLRKWHLKCHAVADSLEEAGDRLFAFTRLDPTQCAMEVSPDHQRHRTPERRVPATDQDPDSPALRQDRANAA
jgi:hypothetical protein